MAKEIKGKVKSALRYSLFDGVSHSFMVGIGEHYLLAYAILMSATDLQLGLVATLPIFLASILQLFSIKVMHTIRSRKKSVLLFASLQGLTWIPIIFVYSFIGIKIPSLIFFVSLYWIFGLIASQFGQVGLEILSLRKLEVNTFPEDKLQLVLLYLYHSSLAGLF